jgi:hypothetical protein
MGFRYLLLDSDVTQMESVETTAKVLEVPTSNSEPFVSALWVLSYLAYPNPDETPKQEAYFRALEFRWQIQHVDANLMKMFVEKKYLNILTRGGKKIEQRVSAGRIALIQIFRIKRDGQPTLQDQQQHERILLGWSKDATESDSTYKTKVWGPSRPVLHIATALTYVHAANIKKSLMQVLFDLVYDPLALIGLLELAENLRRGLPSINSMYSLDQFVKLYVARPISVDERQRSGVLKRPVNLFVTDPAGRFAQMSPFDWPC